MGELNRPAAVGGPRAASATATVLARVLAPLAVPVVLGGLWAAGVQGCPFFVLTGVDCPGCGMVRACVALLRGDVGGSLALHPLAPFTLIAVGLGYLRHVRYAWVGQPAPRLAVPNAVAFGVAGVFLGVWAIRLAGGLGGLPDPVAPSQGWVMALARTIQTR